MPENGVVLGAIRAFYGRPIPPETVDSMVSGTLRIAVPCLLGTEPVSFGYRCVFRVPSRRMGGVIRVRIGVIQVPIRTFGGI